MEDARSKYPSLPSNYVSILQLQERWIKDQLRIQEEKEQEQYRESHTPTQDNEPIQNDTSPKFKGPRKSRPNGDKHRRVTDQCSQKPKEVDEDRQKVELRRKNPSAAKVKTYRRTGQVKSQNTEQAEVDWQKPESLKVKKDGRTVEVCCQKSEMEAMVVVVGEEIKDNEQKSAGLKKKKKKNGRTKPRAEEELAGGTAQPASKNGNEEKFPGRVNQMDGIHRKMEKLSVDPGKVGGSHRSTSTTYMNGNRWKSGVYGGFGSHKANGAALVWVRKGETSDGNGARTSYSGGSGNQR